MTERDRWDGWEICQRSKCATCSIRAGCEYKERGVTA